MRCDPVQRAAAWFAAGLGLSALCVAGLLSLARAPVALAEPAESSADVVRDGLPVPPPNALAGHLYV